MSYVGNQRRLWSAIAVWLLGSVAGFLLLLDYKSTPGPTSDVPRQWPLSASITRLKNASTLLLFAHPRCPCTRASLNELALIMASRREALTTSHVVFRIPESAPADWLESDIVRQAQGIKGVNVIWDRDGSFTAQFGARTSGHVVLYDHHGELVFSGGITGLRGHEGQNAGREIVLAWNQHPPQVALHTPVFGCSLVGSSDVVCTPQTRSSK